MKKVAFYTLGCKLNFSETSTIARQFEAKGYQRVDFSAGADIYIINTCSVTDNADKKCRKVVREAQALSPNAFVAIMGCYAQLKPKEISQIEGVDVVLGAAEKFRLLELIDDFSKQHETKVLASDIDAAKQYHTSYSLNDRTRTFLKVQDGCNYHCTFCTIPLARGKSRSDSIQNIVIAAQNIADKGVKEVVITGVNTGDFGIVDGKRKERFSDLVRALDEVEGIDRFRISSIEPNLLSDDIIEVVSQSHRFVPHFHIPLQSGNNEILAAMRRRYQRELYADRVSSIRSLMPHACIGVDVIVGFPGETQDHFLDTYTFINELDVSYLHVFAYSERANTPAASMEGAIPKKARGDRSKMLRGLSEKKRRAFYESQVGREEAVLFENDVENGIMHGFTRNYVRVAAKYDPLLINEVKPVKLVTVNEAGLMEIAEPEMAV